MKYLILALITVISIGLFGNAIQMNKNLTKQVVVNCDTLTIVSCNVFTENYTLSNDSVMDMSLYDKLKVK